MIKRGSIVGLIAAGAAAAAGPIPFNGWYHCEMNSIDYNTYVRASASSKATHRHVPFMNVEPSLVHSRAASQSGKRQLNSYTNYECGEFQMPMCHEEVCHDARGKTIDIFVKRKLANPDRVAEIGKEKVLWVMQGGPGDSSTAMEQLMSSLYWELNETVSIYTMDHRGTGRSNRLVCNAAEAMTSGSAGGLGITADEYPACIQDLLFQMDNHPNAFSVTSAAYDLKKVIEATQTANSHVFVYALSYGTYLVERLMQLSSPAIAGYVVDSVVSQSAPDYAHMASFSNWDKDVAAVGDRFFALCGADAFCSAKFNQANVSQVTWGMYASLDDAAAAGRGVNTCADMIDDLGVGPPSDSLRSLLGTMLQSTSFRELIPALVYRLVRCDAKDVDVVQTFLDKYVREEGRWSVRGSGEDTVLYYSELLYGLIVYSEMWEHPTPSYKSLYDTFRQGIMGGDTYALVQSYCTFTGSTDPACAEFNLPPSAPFRYEPDAFWNVTAAVPAHATALLMSGGLDPQTERRYAQAQYAAMKGQRRLIEFPQAAHCTTFSTHRTTGGNTCGVKILASYVLANGTLDAVDTSCIADVVPVRFDGTAYAATYFGTTDAFDGETTHYAYVQQAAKKGAHGATDHEVGWVVAVAFLSAAVVMAVAVAVRSSVHLRRLQIKCETDPSTLPVQGPGIVLDLNDDDDRTPGTPPDPVIV